MKSPSFKKRIRIISFFILLFAGILISKLFFVQVVNSSSYASKADKQYATPSSDIFDRGSIFFSKKDGSLVAAATISSGFKIALDTKDISDPEDLYIALEPYLEMDHDTFI